MSAQQQQRENVGVEGNPGGDKSKKYDRQLRLWGDHGQAALEASKVCLINATATGTEILKNLILPGVGSFTIVDGKKVAGEDVGNNFFLNKDSIGESRAQVATELLLELNEDVNGDFVEESIEDLLEDNASFFTSFNVVIATALPEKPLLKLAKLLWDNDIPLLVCSTNGMIGYMRLAIKEHTVVESHPDNAHEDLRLDRPFPALVEYCDSLDLETMSKKDHSHTPWLVLIYKYLQLWKQTHGGEPPKNYKEKGQLKELIREGIRKNEEGVPEDEENFDEAIKNVNTALVPTRIPDTVQKIFSDDCCINLHQESTAFWILARAVKEFVENEGEGALPLRGSIPDMTADSERYIALQNVYREQSNRDIAAISSHLHTQLQHIGKSQDGITETDIRTFCKNTAFIRVLRYRSLEKEYDQETSQIPELAYRLEDEEDDLIHYVMLRAVDKFYSEYNRYPGWLLDRDTMEGDIPKLKACLMKLLQTWGITMSRTTDDLVHEYCRYGASELHTVAAYLGGSAAQEVIKILTSQFVPINNTFLYNAMKQSSVTVEL